MRKIRLAVKRCCDVVFSGVGIIISIPILLVAAALIKITMPGPVFFEQERIGKNGKLFRIYKLRTMKVDRTAEDAHNASGDALRITRTGEFLRRYKIDELPQVFNVFIGNMSLVGPRPAFPEHLQIYNAREKRRLAMRPGMTGLAQVNGNAAIRWEDRIEYDIQYIENYNLLLDLKILIKTIGVVFEGESKFAHKLSETEDSRFIYS